MDIVNNSSHSLIDILSARKNNCNIIWISFHKWNSSQFKGSYGRNSIQIKKDVYKNPIIKVNLIFGLMLILC